MWHFSRGAGSSSLRHRVFAFAGSASGTPSSASFFSAIGFFLAPMIPLSDAYRGSFSPFCAVSTTGRDDSTTSCAPSISRWAVTFPAATSSFTTLPTWGRSRSSATIGPTSDSS